MKGEPLRLNLYSWWALAVVALVISVRACQGQPPIDFQRLSAQLLNLITNKGVSDENLLETISRLGRVTEPSSFWNKIADDTSYSRQHRIRAIFALLRRHCADCW